MALFAGFRCCGLETLQIARDAAMKAKPPVEPRVDDLVRREWVNIIDLRHERVPLAELIDWSVFDRDFGAWCAGESASARKASSGLPGETIEAAERSGTIKAASLSTVVVDTTVQPRAIAHPTDSRLLNRAREQLVDAAKAHGVELRQSYARIGPHAVRVRREGVGGSHRPGRFGGWACARCRAIRTTGLLERRQVVEPVIGHMKADGLLARNGLNGELGDALHAVMCGAGHTLRLILARLRALCISSEGFTIRLVQVRLGSDAAADRARDGADPLVGHDALRRVVGPSPRRRHALRCADTARRRRWRPARTAR